MPFSLKALPYAEDALAPHISKSTVHYHYHKHHQGYVDKLNAALAGEERKPETLEEIINHADGKVYNLAAQVWNHDFYWQSMMPDGGGSPPRKIADRLDSEFGSYEKFRERFIDVAKNEFGSGWAWLLVCEDGGLAVESTTDAVNPLTEGKRPVATLDVWEHAYYLDYQNAREKYIETFLDHLLNWDFVAKNLGVD